ncbi:MAG: VWA domain-containing protein [Okeania sp. SIO3C4]|nr:VWA domain-containing protein [Okeania sp. SIO3B3]NER04860.1 VWA domain-containing protein [Okeania sp. SIO3C4]
MFLDKASPLFGKINVYPPEGGKQRVEIYIRLDQRVENMEIGIAIDGSASMQPLFAANLPKAFRQPGSNVMEPVVRRLCNFVCDYSGDGTVLPIYWAVGNGGKEIEPIGKVSGAASKTLPVEGPKSSWGGHTSLLPALDYFLSEFSQANWVIVLFITDGRIEDLDAVVARAMEVGKEVVAEKKRKFKFVVVGLTHAGVRETEIEAMKENLEKLDNMFDGTELEGKVDLWDCKLAEQMNELQDIWDEVDFGITIPGNAQISDDRGNVIQSYSDGIPQRMEFSVSPETSSVTIEIAGETIVQPLS